MRTHLVCVPKMLPPGLHEEAARIAVRINPANQPQVDALMAVAPDFVPTPAAIAALTTNIWHTNGVHLTVGFLDGPPADLRARILSHMNAWGQGANIGLVESSIDPQVRIARDGGDQGGYWSYIGTQILAIHKDRPTMNLEGFTMDFPDDDAEFRRIVRHETGHTVGFVHEHLRVDLVADIDPQRAIDYYHDRYGWSAAKVRQQVLTSVEESSLQGTYPPDPNSIMCYNIPGTITRSGNDIIGGTDIDLTDHALAAKLYPSSAGAADALRPALPPALGPFAAGRAPSALRYAEAGAAAPLLCFGPGTDPSFVAAVIAALRWGPGAALDPLRLPGNVGPEGFGEPLPGSASRRVM